MNPSHQSWKGICWRKYVQLQVLQKKVVHIRWTQDVHIKEIHRRQPSYVPNQRYESRTRQYEKI